eukprot:SAG11_NODE_1161_length_5638_cov_10.644545_2_plen_89_part_00
MNADFNDMAPGDSSVVKNVELELSKQTSGCIVIRFCCDEYGNKSSTKPRPRIGDSDTNDCIRYCTDICNESRSGAPLLDRSSLPTFVR